MSLDSNVDDAVRGDADDAICGSETQTGLRRRRGASKTKKCGMTQEEEPALVEDCGGKGQGESEESLPPQRSNSSQIAQYAADYETLLGGGGGIGGKRDIGGDGGNAEDVGFHLSDSNLDLLGGGRDLDADAVVDAVRLGHYTGAVGLHSEGQPPAPETGCGDEKKAEPETAGKAKEDGGVMGHRIHGDARRNSASSFVAAAATAESSSSGGLGEHYARGVTIVDAHFRCVAFGALLTYFTLASLSYYLCPPEDVIRLEGTERHAAGLAASMLFVACLSNMIPVLFRGRSRAMSGVIWGALVVQLCAMMTDFAMASFPTPVMLDPVAGTRVHLLRWCEWTPLAFLMTFLTIGTDLPDRAVPVGAAKGAGGDAGDGNGDKWHMINLRTAYLHASAQGLSTVCGLAFPFCPGPISWWVVMIISWILFVFIFERLYVRVRSFRSMSRGSSISEMEVYNRARLSLKLLVTCAVMWSTLVVVYTFSIVVPHMVPEGSFLADPALTMVCECTMDVLAKILYLTIIVDVHDAVFDQGARAKRRLEELRQMMSVVWDNSSDVIGISVRSIAGTVTTMLSPTYLKICVGDQGASGQAKGDGANAVVFELDACEFQHGRFDDAPESQDNRGGGGTTANAIRQPPPPGSPLPSSSPPRKVEPRIVYNVEFSSISDPAARAAIFPQTESFNAGVGAGEDSSSGKKVYGSVVAAASPELPRVSSPEISSMADLLVRAWDVDRKETLLMHDLVRVRDGQRHSIRCEAKVTRLEDNALVVVMRDISERFRRFEAEKRVISETTARQKDAEANRFTRHEVKNGLLAAIGLCDSLRDTIARELQTTTQGARGRNALPSRIDGAGGTSGENGDVASSAESLQASLKIVQTIAESVSAMQQKAEGAEPALDGSHSSATDGGGQVASDISRCMAELDKTLHEILDTILAEAMARDVVHEVYEPKLERVDIGSILCGSSFPSTLKRAGLERFPLITHPSPLPLFAFDPQLFTYIHRNAVSNACKYGKKGGVVMTEVRYDEGSSILEMDVINLPGDHHDKILKMGRAARDAVFSPRRRLHTGFGKDGKNASNNVLESHSSGDGAWIMHKCAKTLGGECDIRFESNRTVFSLRCVATPFDVAMKMATSVDPVHFKLPRNTWGIAIDDSKIQRKLLERFFVLAGVKRDRCIIMGKDADEIRGFDDYVVQHMDLHPNDYVFLIADENLDVVEEAARHVTISGSLCIENIRHRLLPEQERRMLALVRSANDSSHDVAIYNSRAHGFLPKAPIQRDRVLEMLAPIWERRYPPNVTTVSEPAVNEGNSASAIGVETDEGAPRRSVSVRSFTDESTEELISFNDLMGEIEDLDTLCNRDDDALVSQWPLIWERLHLLKGDLKSLPNNGRASAAVEMINALRGTALPPNFKGRWLAIRALVTSMQSYANRTTSS